MGQAPGYELYKFLKGPQKEPMRFFTGGHKDLERLIVLSHTVTKCQSRNLNSRLLPSKSMLQQLLSFLNSLCKSSLYI